MGPNLAETTALMHTRSVSKVCYFINSQKLEFVEMMKAWNSTIRPQIEKEDSGETFLLKVNGRRITSAEAAKEIDALGNTLNMWLPTAKMGRKLTSTASSAFGEDAEMAAAVHMSHGIATARKNYKSIGQARPENVAKRHKAIKRARKGCKTSSSSSDDAPRKTRSEKCAADEDTEGSR